MKVEFRPAGRSTQRADLIRLQADVNLLSTIHVYFYLSSLIWGIFLIWNDVGEPKELHFTIILIGFITHWRNCCYYITRDLCGFWLGVNAVEMYRGADESDCSAQVMFTQGEAFIFTRIYFGEIDVEAVIEV